MFGVSVSQSDVPDDIGELNVNVKGTGYETVEIQVFTDGPVFGSRSSWYPTMGRWNEYLDYGTFMGQHIDRGGTANADTIGYAKYYILINGQQIYVDFRDADYQTEAYTGLDIWIEFQLGSDRFFQIIADDTVWIEEGYGVGIWDNGRKASGSPRVPVTVRNSFNGGYGGSVTVDEVSRSSPYQAVWSLGNHSIAASYFQGGSWAFDYWSDAGAQSHTVSASLGTFGDFFTAYYYYDGLRADPPLEEFTCYPNPFNPSTSLVFAVAQPGFAHLAITDNLGREVVPLMNDSWDAGTHHIAFDGSHLASGVYYFRLIEPGRTRILKVLLMR